MATSLPYITHLRFNQALVIVRSIPEQEVALQPIPTDRLKFYGLYKQAIYGECTTTKPSSRNVVEYAKWKAWYRVRSYSCMEAKTQYVNLVVELLTEFINRYPNNSHHEFAKQALYSLESNIPGGAEVIHHHAGEPSSFIPLTAAIQHYDTTPTYYTKDSSISKSPSLQASTAPSSVTTHNNDGHPWTPTATLHHTQTPVALRSMIMECTTPNTKKSELRRISTTTSSSSSSSSNKQKLVHHPHRSNTRRVSLTERKSLEKLHMDIAALTNQMNQLGQDILVSYGDGDGGGGLWKRRHNSMISLGWRLVKTLLRHLLMNALMTSFVFWILWYQQSPIIHAMVDFLTPRIKSLVRSSIIKKMMFWQIKV